MKKIVFYCDSTMNILTAYFISKVYYPDDYKVLMISNNSSNSVQCVKRANSLNVWNEVRCIYEFGKSKEELFALGNDITIEPDYIIHLYALNNRFAQVLLNKAVDAGTKFILTDEGYWTFNNFLECVEKDDSFCWLNFDITKLKIEAWAYEPQMCKVPDYVTAKRIQLGDALKDASFCAQMQDEVKQLFGIQDCPAPDIIYFDDYLSLRGTTAPVIEKYMLKLINNICSEYDYCLKKHPMERGWKSKYDGMDVKFLPYENAPWEAIFFACMYNKVGNKNIILLTQSSTAVVNAILMFKVYNFKIILLHPLFEKIKKTNWWTGKEYFNNFMSISESNKESIIIPQNLCDLVEKIADIFHRSVNKTEVLEKILSIQEEALVETAEEVNELEHVLIQPLELIGMDGEHQVYYNEHVLFSKEEKFEIEYLLSNDKCIAVNRFEWKANEKGRVCFKSLDVTGYTVDENDVINLSNTVQNNNQENGIFLNDFFYRPNIIFDGMNKSYQKIRITGEVIWDMSLEGIRTSYEEIYASAIGYWIEKDRSNLSRIEVLDKKNVQFEEKVKKYEEEVQQRDEKIRKLYDSQKKDMEEITYIYNSFSWRITKPLRWLKKIFTFEK